MVHWTLIHLKSPEIEKCLKYLTSSNSSLHHQQNLAYKTKRWFVERVIEKQIYIDDNITGQASKRRKKNH